VSIDDHDLYTLHVLGPNNQVIRSKGDEEHVVQTLKNNLTIPEVLPRKHHQPRILRNFDIPTRITFRQNIERNLTEMELRTGDMPGLLSRLGAVFYELDLTVRNALITTLGEQAEDVFYITWRDGSMILDTYDQEYIRLRITEALKI
jgi:[protein-PII] uridylyltransferase